MILYSGPLSMFSAKVEIALLEKNLPYERVFVPFSLATLYQPKHSEVARINPRGQVPVLVDGECEIFDPRRSLNTWKRKRRSLRFGRGKGRRGARARLAELNRMRCSSPMSSSSCQPNWSPPSRL